MDNTPSMTGAEAVIRCLEAEGVTDVFGLPGGAILPLYDAWAHHDHTIRHYLVRHEQGAGHMAQGYATRHPQGRRRDRDLRPRRHQSGDADRRCLPGLHPDRLHHRPGADRLIGTDAFQEADITGHHHADRQALLAGQATCATCRGCSRRRSISPAPAGRPGADRRAQGCAAGVVRLRLPAPGRHARYKPSRHGHPKQIITAAEAILAAERPVLYVVAAVTQASTRPS